MKKFLLSLSAAVACMSMSAAVPTLQDQFNGSFNVTQENPNYSNPSAYDANGNLIIAGAFNDMFGNLEAIGTSAYIVKYDKSNAQQWSVALTGSATITAIDTDAAGNIYVAGSLADVVEFGTTSGETISKEGLESWGEYVTDKNTGFIAKYDANGKLLLVRSFVPEVLPAITEETEKADAAAFHLGIGECRSLVYDMKVDGSKVYLGVTVRGELNVDGVIFEGTYFNGDGFIQDLASEVVFSLDTNTLAGCEKLVNMSVDGPLVGYDRPNIIDATFTVNNGKIYAAFIATGLGTINYSCGTVNDKAVFDGSEQYYVVFSENAKSILKQTTPSSSAPASLVDAIYVENGTIYVVGTAKETLPALEISENAVKTDGVSDAFVAMFDATSLTYKNLVPNKNAEGADLGNDKPNYETVSSSAFVDGAIYINTEVYNYDWKFVKLGASCWFDGTAFSAAPVAATGIAVGNGVAALVASDATKVDYSTYTFTPTQSGISGIEADFDENAPVEYFNLQGIRVANPENGLYIRRQGNKVEKVIL